MNPQPATLQNPKTGMVATPTATTTPEQVAGAISSGFTSNLSANTTKPAVIPPSAIGTQPIQLPQPKAPTTYTSPTVGAPSGTTVDANGNVIINEQPAPKTPTQTKLDTIGTEMAKKADVTTNLQTENDLAGKTLAATKSYNTYNQKKIEYAQKIEAMKTAEANTIGTGGGGYSSSIQEFERKANADLANLAVQANMDQGNLVATEKIIKDKLDAQFDPLKEQADFFFKLAQNENNDLTESQKIKLTQIGTMKQKEWQATQDVATDIHKALVANGRADLFSSVDTVLADYASGKITAEQAQSKMYQATGAAGIDAKLTHVQLADGSDVMVDNKGKIVSRLGGGNGTTTPLPDKPELRVMAQAFNSAATGLSSVAKANQARGNFNQLITSGQIPAAKEYLVRTAVEGMPAADQSQIVGRMQAVESLAEIQGLLDKAKAAGADTNILSGNLVNVAQKLGTTSNQDLSYIGSRIQQVLQTYRRSMTGVAFSPSESKEYAKIMPDITNVDTLNTTKISALKDGFNNNNRTALSFAMGPSNYDQIFGKPEIPKLPSEQTKQAAAPAIAPAVQSILDKYGVKLP